MSCLTTLSDFDHEEYLSSSLPGCARVLKPDCKGSQAAAAPQPEVLLISHHILPVDNLPGHTWHGHAGLNTDSPIALINILRLMKGSPALTF